MILRFKSASNKPQYIAVNTALQTYTTKPEEVKKGVVITLFCNDFEHVVKEINFNGYDYTDDLQKPVDAEPLPF